MDSGNTDFASFSMVSRCFRSWSFRTRSMNRFRASSSVIVRANTYSLSASSFASSATLRFSVSGCQTFPSYTYQIPRSLLYRAMGLKKSANILPMPISSLPYLGFVCGAISSSDMVSLVMSGWNSGDLDSGSRFVNSSSTMSCALTGTYTAAQVLTVFRMEIAP